MKSYRLMALLFLSYFAPGEALESEHATGPLVEAGQGIRGAGSARDPAICVTPETESDEDEALLEREKKVEDRVLIYAAGARDENVRLVCIYSDEEGVQDRKIVLDDDYWFSEIAPFLNEWGFIARGYTAGADLPESGKNDRVCGRITFLYNPFPQRREGYRELEFGGADRIQICCEKAYWMSKKYEADGKRLAGVQPLIEKVIYERGRDLGKS